jgi:hypothetical protein
MQHFVKCRGEKAPTSLACIAKGTVRAEFTLLVLRKGISVVSSLGGARAGDTSRAARH